MVLLSQLQVAQERDMSLGPARTSTTTVEEEVTTSAAASGDCEDLKRELRQGSFALESFS